MSLVIGVALLCTFVLACRVLYIGTRQPEMPWWAGEGWVSTVFCPALVVLFAFGGGFIVVAVFHWQQQGFGSLQAAEVVAVLAATAFAMILLGRIKTGTASDLTAKLAQIRTTVIPATYRGAPGTDGKPPQPTSPGTRRAA
jgi:hypothetical protein